MINLNKQIYSPDDSGLLKIYFYITPDYKSDFNVEAIGFLNNSYSSITDSIKLFKISDSSSVEIGDKIIKTEDNDSDFYIELNVTGKALDNLYIRLSNEDISSTSQKVLISVEPKLCFTTKPIQFPNMPSKVKILDNKFIFDGNKQLSNLMSLFDISIEVTNNFGSTVVVWEDATQCYQDKLFYEFTNKKKDDQQPWNVAVKYTITKKNPVNNIEINSIDILVI